MTKNWKIYSFGTLLRRQPKAVLIAGTILLTYIVIILGRAVWLNYQVNQQIKSLEREIAQIEQQNKDLQNLISYFKTDSYREKELRQKLSYSKPGETVIVTPKDSAIANSAPSDGIDRDYSSKPNWYKWYLFFFE